MTDWPDDPFDGPVILLDEIVQLHALTDFDRMAGFVLKCLKDGVGATLVDCDLARKTMLL